MSIMDTRDSNNMDKGLRFKTGAYLKDVTDRIIESLFPMCNTQEVWEFEGYKVVINTEGYFVIGNKIINYLTAPIMPISILPVDNTVPSNNPDGVLSTFELEDRVVYYIVNIGT